MESSWVHNIKQVVVVHHAQELLIQANHLAKEAAVDSFFSKLFYYLLFYYVCFCGHDLSSILLCFMCTACTQFISEEVMHMREICTIDRRAVV